ncbi:MAG: hypothetical protein KC550_00150 [Nanoarchaeota archaeon]|nr:hypothetical protein [Nanoarchaeota archaeon]
MGVFSFIFTGLFAIFLWGVAIFLVLFGGMLGLYITNPTLHFIYIIIKWILVLVCIFAGAYYWKNHS